LATPERATAVCRDCGRGFPAPEVERRCPHCDSPRIVEHAELAELTIAHIDCDAFYAAIEKRDDPAIRDQPVVVGGRQRGVVMACCYIARRYGLRSAMPMTKALRLCPHAVVVPPDMAKYVAVGRQVRELMLEATPAIEPLSIDEAFLDLSGTEAVHRAYPAQVLVDLARRVERELAITISIGLSYNKFLAKVASDLDKPRGFAIIGRAEAQAFLADKPVRLLWGVGPALERKLHRDGIMRVGQLREFAEQELVAR
jgi:DNA polymerase-4